MCLWRWQGIMRFFSFLVAAVVLLGDARSQDIPADAGQTDAVTVHVDREAIIKDISKRALKV